jgi:hypothetical protein
MHSEKIFSQDKSVKVTNKEIGFSYQTRLRTLPGWESYDSYYAFQMLSGTFDTIACTLVLNLLSRNDRKKSFNI